MTTTTPTQFDQAMDEYILQNGDPRLTNGDLIPTPVNRRNWTSWNYATLWMGMVHNIFGFSIIGGFMALGMSAGQALFSVGCACLVQLALLGLTGRVGARFGIPFPVWARSAYGVFGANVPAILRGLAAIGWFGIQNYLGATIVNALLSQVWAPWRDLGHHTIWGIGLNLWIGILIYWAINFLVIHHGMDTIRRFETWAGPMVFIVMLGLVIWAISKAHGIGPIFSSPSKYTSTADFLAHGWIPAMAAFISAGWATMILNYPDLSRFARSNRQQAIGTFIGLPVATCVYYTMAAIVVSGVLATTGKTLWNPGDVLVAVGVPWVTVVGALLLALATISVNIPANLVSPAYDLNNLFPRFFTFKRGAVAGIIIAFLYMPWKWMQMPTTMYGILNNIGAFLGPATGILLADFFIIRQGKLDVEDLYRLHGRYEGFRGFNILSLAVLAVTTIPILVGEVWKPLSGLYTYSWFVGVGASFVVYLAAVKIVAALQGRVPKEFQAAGTSGVEAAEVAAT